MTKKVNSTTLRLGYNLFWKYKKTNFFHFYNFRTLLNFCQQELSHNFCWCINLKIRLNILYLNVYLYNYYKIKNIRFNFDNYTFNSLSFKNHFYTKFLLTKLKLHNYYNNHTFFKIYFSFFLNYFFYIEKVRFLILGFTQWFYLLSLKLICCWGIFVLKLLKPMYKNTLKFHSISAYFTRMISLNIVSKHLLLKYKLIEVSLEYLILKYYNFKFNVYVNNLLNKKLLSF
jgi:hypothetical protein